MKIILDVLSFVIVIGVLGAILGWIVYAAYSDIGIRQFILWIISLTIVCRAFIRVTDIL